MWEQPTQLDEDFVREVKYTKTTKAVSGVSQHLALRTLICFMAPL
jgi:hypothetical protein